MPNVSKEAVKDKLSTMLKVKMEAIQVFGLKTKFGGGRSSGFALVYDSQDAKKKYDFTHRMLKVRKIADLRKINLSCSPYFPQRSNVYDYNLSCLLGETYREEP